MLNLKAYSEAREALRRTAQPVETFIQEAEGVIAEYRLEARQTKEMLEELRPVWAQGFTSDSMAAQANGNALAELWALLGASNQTAAMERLRDLVEEKQTAATERLRGRIEGKEP